MSWREKLRELEQEFGSVTRDSRRKPAEMGEGFELERGISCSYLRWRTKLDLGSCESFDDHHRATTFGTAPETVQVKSAGGVLLGLRFLGDAEQLKAKRQKGGASAVGQEAEVAEAHETFGEQV